MNFKKRMAVSLLAGAALGVVCIIGVGSRLGFDGNWEFLMATWFNRLLMGLVIGLAGHWTITRGQANPIIRGLILGSIVSFSFYFATDFRDTMGFLAGIAYGPIIDYLATALGSSNKE